MMNPIQPEDALGYYFHPADDPDDPGHPALSAYLRPAPTGQHYDPDRAIFPITGPHFEPLSLVVDHPWQGDPQVPIAAGRVELVDFRKKNVEAFTFGGQLHVEVRPDLTVCTLNSPAPILNLYLSDTTAYYLAEEFEILLAGRRAAWLHEPDTYDRRLAQASPGQLYHAALHDLHARLQRIPRSGESDLERLILFVSRAYRQAREQHGAFAERSLQDIL